MPVRIKFLSYKEARKVVRKLGLKNERQWYRYCGDRKKPFNIPSVPHHYYKNCGWVSWMDWLGYSYSINDRRYHVNDNYFKKWSSNMAYILGFWFADGYISKKKGCNTYIFSITQNEKDKYLLEKILKEMKSNYYLQYTKKHHCYSFKVCSKIIYNDIIRLGGKERKSLDVKFPNVPKKYLPDFVRGLWDGDGCITYNKRQQFYNSNYVCGSKDFIEQLHAVLKKNIFKGNGDCLDGSLTLQPSGVYRLLFGRDDTIRLKNFMYQGSMKDKLMLKRKYELFLKTPGTSLCDFLDYNSSKKIVKSFKIKSRNEWRRYCRLKKRPSNIPSQPHKIYNNKGWISYALWFGCKSNEKFCNKKYNIKA